MRSKIRHTPLIAGVAALILACGAATPAFASTEANPDAIADAVAAAAPTEIAATPLEIAGEQLTSAFTEGGHATLGVQASDGLTFTTNDGSAGASLTLPGAAQLADGVVGEDGSITYAGDAQQPSVNVVTSADAVRVSTVITNAAQTGSFDYDFGVGTQVEIQADGSAIVISDTEKSTETDATIDTIVATVNAPWAVDAAGADVETYYIANGSVLTQVVNHQGAEVAYPVVADPTVDQPNIFQYRVRFNRAETASIASGGWGGVVGSLSCGIMAPVCAVASGALAYNAGVAQNSSPKRCVQVTATQPMVVPGMVWWVDTYAGGPCS